MRFRARNRSIPQEEPWHSPTPRPTGRDFSFGLQYPFPALAAAPLVLGAAAH